MLVNDDGSHDAEPIRIAMHAQLTARHIDNRAFEADDEGHVLSPASTEEFAPDATLRITPTLTIRTPIGLREEVHVDASLYLPGETSHRIWRAKAIHGTGTTNVDASGTPIWAMIFARHVVDQLFADGVLR